MLPSTGYFKDVTCPFYDSGLCERPYCHFRHIRKEPPNTLPPSTAKGDGDILHRLVSQAVKKVLQQQRTENSSGAVSSSEETAKVEDGNNTDNPPPIPIGDTSAQDSGKTSTEQVRVPLYKPTPIAVLKKRHIPIPYSPSLTKSSNVVVKRRTSISDSVLSRRIRLNRVCEPDSSGGDNLNSLENTTSMNSESMKSDQVITTKSSSECILKPISTESSILSNSVYKPTSITNPPLSSSSSVTSSEVMGSSKGRVSSSNKDYKYEPSSKESRKSDKCPKYSPAPVGGWTESRLSYIPSNIETLQSQQNSYVPVSKTSELQSSVTYKPTDLLQSKPEPTYVPSGANSSSANTATYKPSSISNAEPEYQPLTTTLVKEYVPTEISKLDNSDCDLDMDYDLFSSDIDLIHDIISEDLKENSSSEETTVHIKKHSKREHGSGGTFNGERKVKNNREKNGNMSEKNSLNDKKNLRDDKSLLENRKHSSSDKHCASSKNVDKYHVKKSNIKNDFIDKKSSSRKEKNSHSSSRKHHVSSSDKHHEHSSDKHRVPNSEKLREHNSDRHCVQSSERHSEHRKHSSNKGTSEKQKPSKHPNKEDKYRKKEKGKSSGTNDKPKHQENHKQRTHSSGYHASKHSSTSKHKIHKREISDGSTPKIKNSKLSAQYSSHSGNMKHSHKGQSTEGSTSPDDYEETAISSEKEGSIASDTNHCDGSDIFDDVTLPSDMGVSSSEDEVTKECFRIFQEEYKPSKSMPLPGSKRSAVVDHDSSEIPKKRIAHGRVDDSVQANPVKKPNIMSQGQIMAERLRRMRNSQQEVDANHSGSSSDQPSSSTMSQPMTSPPSGRVRIAHVPNVTLMLNAKMKFQEQLKERQENMKLAMKVHSATVPPPVVKAGQRFAHMPPSKLSRPIITDVGGKIPQNMRQNYLNVLAEEYLKICPSGEEAFSKATEEEKALYDRCTAKSVYVSLMSNLIGKLRKEGNSAHQEMMLNLPSTSRCPPSASATAARNPTRRTVSHLAVLAGKDGARGSWSIEKPKKSLDESVSPRWIFEQLGQYVMTEEELKLNGYPFLKDEQLGTAIIYCSYKKPVTVTNIFERLCARCGKPYAVNEDGLHVKDNPCTYHWGKLYQIREQRTWEGRYSCCSSPSGTSGCSLAACHVSDGYDPNAMSGFVTTLKSESPEDGNYGVYALDCEMCYTVNGLELTRVTVVGTDLNIVYESLVKPANMIIDYNSRFSGIHPGDLDEVTTTLEEVQCYLLELFSEKTILVGHSLENDLKALKIIHKTVVDTSVVFPHKYGPPKKRALKNLALDFLKKVIQCGEGGHDSAEDARACMELMLHKVKKP